MNGTATIRCSAQGLSSVEVTATEEDNDADEREGELPEGELVEGEREGEGEGDGEGEDEACGCCKPTDKNMTPTEVFKRMLGDWLIIGIAWMVLLAIAVTSKR